MEIAKPVTKWAVQLKEPAQAPWVFREAFRIARSGRPGPVLIDLPIDVQQRDMPVRRGDRRAAARRRPAARVRARVGRAVGHAAGRRTAPDPGRRRRDHRRRRRRAARAGRAPAGPGPGDADGQGRVPRGPPAVRRAWRASRPRRAGATRRSWRATWCSRWAPGSATGTPATSTTYRGDRKFIHVDIEPTQIGKVFEPDLGIVGHARPTLAALTEEAQGAAGPRGPGSGPRGSPSCADAAAARRLRRRADQAAAGLPGDQRVLRRRTPRSSPRSGSTRSGPASSRRPTCRGATWSAGRPGRSAGRCPAAMGVKCAFPERPGGGRRRRLLLPVPDGGDRGRRPVPRSRSSS